MKILAFVDTHGNEKYLQHIIELSHHADALICAGDFTIFENNMEHVLQKLNSIGKPIIIFHGNHETSSGVLSLSSNMHNIHFIHNAYYIVNDVIFFGYGGGGFGTIDPKFEIVSESFMKNLKELEKKNNMSYKIILVTHAPPYNTTLDDLGYPVGSKSIRKFIEESQPLVVVCGHIHECAEKQDYIKNTLIINPGPKGKIVEVW